MVQRADRGEWSIPGGYADVGWSGAEIALKEVKEEAGIEVRVDALLGEFDALRHAGQRIPMYTLLYSCVATGGQLTRHPNETQDVAWFSRSETPTNLWQDGDPWLELSFNAVEGKPGPVYFEQPR